MDDIIQSPKVITGINWATRTFDPREPDNEEIPEPKPVKPEKKKRTVTGQRK